MTLEVTFDGTPVSATRILVGGNSRQSVQTLPAAADGSGAIGAITFDDPDGTMGTQGWDIVQVTEDDCVSAPTLFYGCMGDRTYRRGPYRDGPGREIDASLIDANTFLTMRIVTGLDANRPAETQAQRIAWLLGTGAVVPMFSDLGLVNASVQPLDPTNYRGMYPAEILSDLCTSRNEIFFLYWDQALEEVGLFFDAPTATTFTCTLTVSNVLSDVDDTTCFEPMIDGELYVTPEDIYSTGSMKYTGGSEVVTNLTTRATFFGSPSPIPDRSFIIENLHVGKASTARTLLTRILAADSTEREVLKFTVRLPSTKVGLVQAGMRISCRFSHLPGFTSFAYTRIERLNCIPVDGRPDFYDVALECSTHGLTAAGGTGGGSTDPFPYVPPPVEPSIVQQASGNSSIVMTDPVTAANKLIASIISRGAVPGALMTSLGYTQTVVATMPGGSYQSAIFEKVADGTEGDTLDFATSNVSGTWYELPGDWTVDQTNTGTGDNANAGAPATTGSISVAAGSIVFTNSAYAQGGALDSYVLTGNDMTTTPGSGWTEDWDDHNASGTPIAWTAHQIKSTAGSVTGSSSNALAAADAAGADTTNWCAVIASFVSAASAAVNPPVSGKPWGPVLPNETPDGTITDFTMPSGYTWATGSLQVFVDRLDQTLAITAEDGSAGTFTLGFAPKVGELVEVYGTEL